MSQAACKNDRVKGCESKSFCNWADNFLRSCMLDRLLYETLKNFPAQTNSAQDLHYRMELKNPEKEKDVDLAFWCPEWVLWATA